MFLFDRGLKQFWAPSRKRCVVSDIDIWLQLLSRSKFSISPKNQMKENWNFQDMERAVFQFDS